LVKNILKLLIAIHTLDIIIAILRQNPCHALIGIISRIKATKSRGATQIRVFKITISEDTIPKTGAGKNVNIIKTSKKVIFYFLLYNKKDWNICKKVAKNIYFFLKFVSARV